MDQEERIARVKKYERLFDKALLSPEPETLRLLDEYYTSGAWREDYEADEGGELPPGLKRGVLGQDALYELLEEQREEREVIDAAIDYIRRLFAGNADGHGADHTLRVYANALRLAATEPSADRLLVSLGALLHDADDDKLFETENNANARRFLAEQNIDGRTAERIIEAVNAVSFRKNRGKRPATLEGQIIQDADRLDAIGAIGIGRVFAFGGRHGRPMDASVRHFHEKLLLLKDEMNTPGAKALAEERHAFMEAFLRQWERETGKPEG